MKTQLYPPLGHCVNGLKLEPIVVRTRMGKPSVYHMIPTLSVEKRAGGSIMFKEQTKNSYAWLQA